MKDVLITGAYGGMGKACTRALALRGTRVFALDRKVGAPEDNVIPIEADITNEEEVKRAFLEICKYTDSLSAIVHFAGMYMLDSLVEIEPSEFKRIIEVNLYGVYLINKTFLPKLSRTGKILITTSELSTLDPLPFTGIYAISKGALDKYAYSLRMELQLLGISVSVLRAGAVDTGMLPASTAALDRFCESTTLYTCNADRFKKIVDRVEARCISPEKLAKKAVRILSKNTPAFSYSINRNPLLLLLDALPKRLRFFIIKRILR